MDARETAIVIKILQGAYRSEFRDDSIDVYTEMLSDLDFQIVRQAIANLIRVQRFLPAISEIREECLKLSNPLPTVDQAYCEARSAAHDYSPYDHDTAGETFSHPLIQHAVNVVGLSTMAYTDQPQVVAAQFRKVYERLLHDETKRHMQAPGLQPPRGSAPMLFEPEPVQEEYIPPLNFYTPEETKGGAA